jgi:class 3 adenylate cyclase/tetratricopeptide (TPR) repeat protein
MDVRCGVCGQENNAGRKFCGECGSPLTLACGACGTPNPPGTKFCGECGAPLSDHSRPVAEAATPQAERRLVSVLFADLVGFTTASEGRDAEDTRELLTRYFELARSTIERYGGTVEKFIGDAVMAVWGAPVANEDDAERAVRAALDLTATVPELDPVLEARAGVLTGEAAVTLGATDQGIVAGDLVNTASRIQSAAEPGTVLVGEATKRATEAAIAYADAGDHTLKGKSESARLWQAVRVVAARRGEGRSSALEAPFVGRDREVRIVKELFHATADEGRAHLLSIVGVAGIGKSRLVWEFEKYLDGLADEAWWHKGRCLAYGEGVAYWALAEMIRWRARITEDERAEDALRRLSDTVTELVPDEDERAFVEPRLQHLLGLTERVAPDREDLFSAWRLFLERMAERFPLIMVFEDIQWADDGLLEFLEYLLDWSRGHRILIVTLSRPEIADRHPGWGANLRNFTSLALDPLSPAAIDALLRGLVPGLPDEAVAQIRGRADGIPLYAVETVRMLLDQGMLEPDDGTFRLSGELGVLDVPETLHALIAARLDGLESDERRLLQDAAVLGKTFAPRGLAMLGAIDEETVRPLLASLVRKELLVLDADPRSPERGQYGFLQALVQRVSYETLSRRDRKTKHVAAAAYLTVESGIDSDEIAEVIAAHLLDAYRAQPEDVDAVEIKAQACAWLRRAGERAAALAATDDAQRAFEAAAELAEEPLERARLLERAGDRARAADRLESSETLLRRAQALTQEVGATHDGARVAAELAVTVWRRGRIEEAIALLEDAFAVLAGDDPDADVAALGAQLGRIHYFAGNAELAAARIEAALDMAEELRLPAVISSALNTKSLLVQKHPNEAEALLRRALRIALDNDLVFEALRAYNNLLVFAVSHDHDEETLPLLEEGMALARRRGDRFWEVRLATGLLEEERYRGTWEAALERAAALPLDGPLDDASLITVPIGLARMHIWRGEPDVAREWLTRVPADTTTADFQRRRTALWRRQLEAEIDGRLDDANAAIEEALSARTPEPPQAQELAELLGDASTYATLTGDQAAATRIAAHVDAMPATIHVRTVDSQLNRLRANAAAAVGDAQQAADAFSVALANARNLGYAYWLAPVLYDYGAWLVAVGRAEEAAPLLAEARGLFETMGASAWLERIDRVDEARADTPVNA